MWKQRFKLLSSLLCKNNILQADLRNIWQKNPLQVFQAVHQAGQRFTLPGKCQTSHCSSSQHCSQLTWAAAEVYSVLAEYLLYPLWELHITHKHSDTDVLSVSSSQASPNECLLDASTEQTEQSNESSVPLDSKSE